MEFDIHSDMHGAVAVPAAAITSDTTTVGVIIDTDKYGGLEFLASSGNWTDGAFALIVEHGDVANLSDAEVVPAAELLGTPAPIGADNTVSRVGYVGGTLADGTYAKRRYVRLSIVSTGTTTGSLMQALAILRIPMHGPVADQ